MIMVCRAMIVALWLFMVVIMSVLVIVVVIMSVSYGIVWLCCLGTHGKTSCYLKRKLSCRVTTQPKTSEVAAALDRTQSHVKGQVQPSGGDFRSLLVATLRTCNPQPATCSLLDAAQRDPFDELALGDEEQDDDRQGDGQRRGHQIGPVDLERAAEEA